MSHLLKSSGSSNDRGIEEYKDEEPSNDDATKQQQLQQPVSALERIRILSYRLTLAISALLLTTMAIFGSNFLSGTGIDGAPIVHWAEGILPLAAGSSLLLAPMPIDDGEAGLGGVARVVTTSLGIASIVSAAISHVGSIDTAAVDIARILSITSLMSISLREIWYFGLAYKWEAAIALLTLPLLLVDSEAYYSDAYPIAVPLCALAVDVLAVGKVFEPCREDYVQSNSEFLADE